ncbi:hypothetical protein GXM18_27115 [Blautia producta ATCC 27340 = DSM 2950]|uniref:Uncharacterized protein n=1 Tax=Blautia producta ATCC 27340 = DSM 2950 TaxID=1121114 RepID=A0ABX6J1Q4_9FIRM|nr:hypothetical protein GXM18_27115 [Blautia producta ATCC 27340 = DSM 2950]
MKFRHAANVVDQIQSLSARRVWIEIGHGITPIRSAMVTLCEESVD